MKTFKILINCKSFHFFPINWTPKGNSLGPLKMGEKIEGMCKKVQIKALSFFSISFIFGATPEVPGVITKSKLEIILSNFSIK